MQAYRFWFYTKNANVLENQEDKAMFTDISTQMITITKRHIWTLLLILKIRGQGNMWLNLD
jgi:hypothetical protein